MRINEIITELSQSERKQRAGVKNDQFFTRPEVAEQFAEWVKSHDFYKTVTRTIEPAAGSQDLSRHFPGIEEYDLAPQHPGIQQADFLQSQHRHQLGFLVVMNPPFGKSSDLAIEFFNKATTFADYIAQIVPRTFRRTSVQNKLGMNFVLIDEYILPRGSFYLPSEGAARKYDVPAVAQIWARTATPRKPVTAQKPTGFQLTSNPSEALFAFRRKGRSAGEIITDNFSQANPNSFFFVKARPEVLQAFQRVDWRQYGNDVMGARSISIQDINSAISSIA